MPGRLRRIGPEEHASLAGALGDSEQTFGSVRLLRMGLCNAYVAGEVERFDGVLIQDREVPGELMGFGADPAALSGLLGLASGWWCVSVAENIAPRLGALVAEGTGQPVRYYGDVYHVPAGPVARVAHEAVRLLGSHDLGLIESSDPDLRGGGWGSAHGMLEGGIVAGAPVGERLVAIAHTPARTRGHVDVAVNTLERWRGRGLATAAASVVACRAIQNGQTPVWSCGEGNAASLRVARKLGFVPVARRVYVIPSPG